MANTFDPTARADGLTLSTDIVQAGATFNDASRLLTGGLWSSPTDANNQENSLDNFLADIHTVMNDINADLAQGATVTAGGDAYTLTAANVATLTAVQTQLSTMLAEAPLSVANGPSSVAAQTALHAADSAVLAEINGDTGLAGVLGSHSYASTAGTSDVGFQAPVAGSDSAAAIAAATASGATLAEIGSVFNAAVALSQGGLNPSNLAQFNTDMNAVATGINNILANPTELATIESGESPAAAALTTIHLQTVANQAEWQVNTADAEYATNPNVAARSTSDNLLDMIDIVQNDGNLNTAAGGNGAAGTVGGFAELPGFLTGTITHYQDDQAQTNFWAEFIAEANVLNNDLTAIAGTPATANTAAVAPVAVTHAQLEALITDVQNYNSFGASFAAAEGGTFGARFQNELTQGTLTADSAAAIHGLQGIANGDTGAALAADQAQITAAGTGFVADANDVSGNNNPLGGGTYNGASTTVHDATTVAGIAQGSIPTDPLASTNPVAGSPTDPLAGSTTSTSTGTGATGAGAAGNGATPAAITTLINDFLALEHGTGNASTVFADLQALAGGQTPGGGDPFAGYGNGGVTPPAGDHGDHAQVDHSHHWHL
jgi:hypothetical protein